MRGHKVLVQVRLVYNNKSVLVKEVPFDDINFCRVLKTRSLDVYTYSTRVPERYPRNVIVTDRIYETRCNLDDNIFLSSEFNVVYNLLFVSSIDCHGSMYHL